MSAEREALRRLHDAVVRHGVLDGKEDDETWYQRFSELMSALELAREVLRVAEGCAPQTEPK